MNENENQELLNTALKYLQLGYSFVPAHDKKTTIKWKQYQERQPTVNEIRQWFSDPKNDQLSLVCGRVSGGLIGIDFDHIEDKEMVAATFGMSFEQLKEVTWIVKSPHGYHVHFLCPEAEGAIENLSALPPQERKTPLQIELKTSKTLMISPPSKSEDGTPYENLSDPEKISKISIEDLKKHIQTWQLLQENWQYIEKILQYYEKGRRAKLTLAFAGFLRKHLSLSLEQAQAIFAFILAYKQDEEVAERMSGLRHTYVEIKPEEVAVDLWFKDAGAEELQQKLFELLSNSKKDEKSNAKPVILLPGRDRPISRFAKKLGEFYSNEKKLFYNVTLQEVVKLELIEVDPRKNIKILGFKRVDSNNFITLIEKDFTVGTFIKDKNTGQSVFVEKSMASNIATAVLESDQFREQLPKLRRIYTVPIPTFIGDELVFPRKGYDERLMSWTPENAPDVRLDMPPEEAKALLEDIYSEFAFKNKNVDKYNAIAHLLTYFCRNLYSRETVRTPIFFYIANRERAGKDYCAGVVGIVYEGSAIESPAISTERDVRDEEFRKEVFSALKIGRSRIHSSNNKGYLNSAELERMSTAEQLMDRLLGTNNVVTFPNYLEISISANQGITYTPDLEKRSIFINLFLDLEDPNERVFKRPDLHGFVFEHRSDILSALYSLVLHWVEKGKPACSKPFSSYPEWMRVVGGIMEAAGWPAPSQNSDLDLVGGDKETRDMKKLFELAAEKWKDQPVTKTQIVNEILAPGSDENPNPFGELFGWLGWYDNLNKAKHGFGLLFKKYEGRILSNVKLEVVQVQKGHAERNQYKFVKLDTDIDQTKTGQQDLAKPAENDTNTKEDKKGMEGSEGLEGSTNPSNIENKNEK